MGKETSDRAVWLGRYILPHEPALRTWLNKRSLGALDADDVIQEAYSRLIAAKGVDQIRNHKTYLFQTAKSVVASHFRSAKIVPILTAFDFKVLEAADENISVEDQICDRELLRDIAETIALLPEPTRTIFRLRRVEQVSQREISLRLAMPESTVEKHISRALLFLVQRFGRGGKRAASASMQSDSVRLVGDGKADRSGG